MITIFFPPLFVFLFFFSLKEEAAARRVLVGHAGIHASKCFFALTVAIVVVCGSLRLLPNPFL